MIIKVVLLFSIATACSLGVAKEADWSLIWSDEFNYEGQPDSRKWVYEEGFVRNKEEQLYTSRKKNAYVKDGLLVIEAFKERIKNPQYDPKAPEDDWKRSREYADYTSAAITTQGKASWRYVKIEVKAKLTTGRGSWPAIWTLGSNITEVNWPQCGEIDIMENVGYEPDFIHTNIHTTKFNHAKGTNKGMKNPLSKPHKDFHIYGIEWYHDHIDFFIDRKKVFTFNDDGSGVEAWPFFEPQYLLLNLAVGGGWGGAKGVDENIFPQKMYVDYVRVYENKSKALKGFDKSSDSSRD